MSTLHVSLGERSYPIIIAPGAMLCPANFQPYVTSSQILVVTNTTVDPLYSEALISTLSFAEKVDKVVLPDGEEFKNLTTLNLIFDSLLRDGHNRKTTLIALGGGVVGDMTGFAAATYQRGVNFIQVPTTLLAQVDSSVGGKTGVNHALGKNMIGAFYQPQCVVIDTVLLQSLPKRELSAGLAEVIKYGLIADYDFFVWLENNIDLLLNGNADALSHAIVRSCEIKADVVAQDEKEGGLRAILNFGHTFGHAIESHQAYKDWLHGEAVGSGMLLACKLSARLGWLSEDVVERARCLIQKAGLPIKPPADMTPDIFLKYMAVDKKVWDKQLRLVLLKGCGEAVVTSDFPQTTLYDTLAERD